VQIAQARRLTVGQRVAYPADRGQAAGTGVVVFIDDTPARNIHGTEYLWVTVRDIVRHHRAVWPSNRLSGA
jgi:hypothetical protein